MPTPIKRIEKDFLIKVIYDEHIPLMHIKGQTQYILTIDKPVAKGQMFIKSDRPISGLRVNSSLNLMFDYRGQVIIFSVQVINFKDDHIIAAEPEFLYKDLDRSFSRVSTPGDLHVQFSFIEERYSLSYPKVPEYEADNMADFFQNLNPKDLNGIVEQIAVWVKGFASGHKIVIFKENKISFIEERVLAETGKAFFLPSTKGSLPTEDPYPKKRIVTEDILKKYLESSGIAKLLLDEACRRLIERKQKAGIISDLWAPILFHEYVIGYIRVWIDKEGMLPLDYDVVDNLYQFAKALVYSLKTNGFFEAGKIKNEPFECKIVDISVSGMLFAHPSPDFYSSLMPDTELAVRLKTDQRTIYTKIKVVRRYKENNQGHFGCRFMEMAPEDLRFLFEYIYGRTFTDEDAVFLTGQV